MIKNNRLDGFLTVSQAARALEITSEYVRQLTRQQKLACLLTPLGRLIPIIEIERFQNERKRRQTERAA
jgi:hypothetical protein